MHHGYPVVTFFTLEIDFIELDQIGAYFCTFRPKCSTLLQNVPFSLLCSRDHNVASFGVCHVFAESFPVVQRTSIHRLGAHYCASGRETVPDAQRFSI